MENGEIKTNGAVTVTDDYAVVVADTGALQEFFKEGSNLDALYGVIEKKAKGLVADTSTKEGRSQIKTAAKQLASVKTKVDDIGKQVVAELKALPKVIDANRKQWRESMEALQDEIRKPVTEIEEREKAVEAICNTHLNLAFASSAEIEAEIKKLEDTPLTEDTWKESLKDATMAIAGEINALKVLRDAALKKEEDARRLAELEAKQAEAERIIREQKIKEEAERKAKEEAEARAAAEKARLEREKEMAERIIREQKIKEEAERKAKEEAEARAAAEKARLEREKEMAERRAAEAERKAKEAELAARNVPNPVQSAAVGAQQAVTPMSKTLPTPKPSKWTPEMKAVNKAILDTFSTKIEAEVKKAIVGFTESGYKVAAENTAKALVSAIIKGEIKNLKVEY